MGHCGPTDQVGPLSADTHDVVQRSTRAGLHRQDCPALRSAGVDRLRPGHPICDSLLKESAVAGGHQAELQHYISPHNDDQSERGIQTLEDMLRACVLDYGDGWFRYLPLVEFTYNNSYQASIRMTPYEELYGRRCRSPICWHDVGEHQIIGPDLVEDAESKVCIVKQRLLTAQSKQKSYVDERKRDLEFQVGIMCFSKCHQLGETSCLDCGRSLVRGSWDPLRFLSASVQWHIGRLFLQVSPMCTTYSTSPYFESTFQILPT